MVEFRKCFFEFYDIRTPTMGATLNNESTTTESCDASTVALWFQGHNLNKFGRGQLGGATYRISRLYAFGFLTTRLLCIPYIHGDKVHRILYRVTRCFFPGYIGTPSFTVNITEERMEGE